MTNEIIWRSAVTEDMVRNLSQEEINELIDELNDAVATICETAGVS